MNGKAQDGQERYSWGGLREWICWLGVILLCYVLSSGPLLMLEYHKRLRPANPAYQFVGYLYSPLVWVYQNTSLHKGLGMYWHLCAPGQIDSHGNIRTGH